MSTHCFGLYQGHLSARLIKQVETKFPRVLVINHTEPRGEQRGWFEGPARGEPFDGIMRDEVFEYARSIARGKDAYVLDGE